MVVELSLPNFLQQEQLKTGFFFSIPLDFSDKGEFVTKGYLGLILKRLEWANLLNCANLSFSVQGAGATQENTSSFQKFPHFNIYITTTLSLSSLMPLYVRDFQPVNSPKELLHPHLTSPSSPP